MLRHKVVRHEELRVQVASLKEELEDMQLANANLVVDLAYERERRSNLEEAPLRRHHTDDRAGSTSCKSAISHLFVYMDIKSICAIDRSGRYLHAEIERKDAWKLVCAKNDTPERLTCC